MAAPRFYVDMGHFMNDLNIAKTAMRKAAASRRKKLFSDNGAEAAQSVIAFAIEFVKTNRPGIVAGYYPVKSEFNSLPLMTALAATGIQTALPVIARPGGGLEFHAWKPGEELMEGAHGVPVPAHSSQRLDPDIVITPLLAFDACGHRLGYGGGYYDRTLADLRKKKAITAIGLAFAGQMVEETPNFPHDQRLDYVLSENGMQKCG